MNDRKGFTLIEVLIAMVLLSLLALGTQAAITTQMVGEVGSVDSQAVANQLIKDRIDEIRMDPRYTRYEENYDGDEEDEFDGLPGVTRATRIIRNRDEEAGADYTRIAVTVEVPGLANPMSRTVTVNAR